MNLRNKNWQIKHDPNSWLNQIFPATFEGQRQTDRAYDSERKLILTLLALFELEDIKSLDIELVSENKFCNSCKRIIINFEDRCKGTVGLFTFLKQYFDKQGNLQTVEF